MQQIDTTTVGSHSDKNDNLAEFIKKSKTRLNVILERLQWTEGAVLARFNTNSKAALVEEDAAEASEIDKDAGDREPPLPQSFDSKISIVIAPEKLRKLVGDGSAQIPVKFSDSQVQFTREQRLKLYEYVVERMGKCTERELQVPALNDGQTTFAEIVAQKRREKKNRRRHRTSKPTHVEEVRGLVELQMQALQQYVEAREREERKNQREQEDTKAKTRRSQSRSRDSARHKYLKHKCSRSYNGERRSQSRSRKKHRKRSRSRSHNHSRDRSRSRSRSRHRNKRERSREARDQMKRRSRSRERHANAKIKLESLENREKSPTYRKEHKSSHKEQRRRRSRSGSRTKGHKHKAHAKERLKD